MPTIGFSTGALFKDALDRAVDAARRLRLEAVELSALRIRELAGLVAFVRDHDLTGFRYVALHAPTDFTAEQERDVVEALLPLAREHQWYVVVHPDSMHDIGIWKAFDQWLCIENMDKRKPAGRSVEELEAVFAYFPMARLCFDIAHARQVDTSMTEAYRILRQFRNRICHLHISEVASNSKHERISNAAVESFRRVLDQLAQLPADVPIIVESPVTPDDVHAEIQQVVRVFAPPAVVQRRSGVSASCE
jgi:sugar phosphate isomerase/epimerase